VKNGVSAVLIAKNEGRVIARCIESLSGLDQIVVFDTGSTDATMDIARELGADVVNAGTTTPFHFAMARNSAMAHAKHPWVLTIDADEVLMESSHAELRNAIRDTSVRGIRGTHVNHAPGQVANGFPTSRMMLFQATHWVWRHRIHERLFPVADRVRVKGEKALVVHHLPPAERAERRTQNIELLRLALLEEPNYHFLNLQLGLEHLSREEWPQAVEFLDKYVEVGDFEGTLGQAAALMHLARASARSGDLQKAMNTFVAARNSAPDRREPLYWASVELIRAGCLPDAVQWLQDALKLPPAPMPSFSLYSAEAQGTLIEETLAECRRLMAQVEAGKVS
jgi:hypothetical protein